MTPDGRPFWANGAHDVGEFLGKGDTDSWNVEAWQVDAAPPTKHSMYVGPNTNEGVFPVGSEVVFVNLVFTNTSDHTIMLNSSKGSPQLTSDNWISSYRQPGERSSEAYEVLGINLDAADPAMLSDVQVENGFAFPVKPGQTFSQATSILYEASVGATVEFSLTPVDETGAVLSYLSEHGEFHVFIK